MSKSALPPGKARIPSEPKPASGAPLARSRPIARARPARAPVGGGAAGERDGAVSRAGDQRLAALEEGRVVRLGEPVGRPVVPVAGHDGASERDLLHEQVGVGIVGAHEVPGDVQRRGCPRCRSW